MNASEEGHHVANFLAAQRICAYLDWSDEPNLDDTAIPIRSPEALWVVFGLLAEPRQTTAANTGHLPTPEAELPVHTHSGQPWRIRWQRHTGTAYPVLTAVADDPHRVQTAHGLLHEHSILVAKCHCPTGSHERIADAANTSVIDNGVIQPDRIWQKGA